jgi:hypothetical protein
MFKDFMVLLAPHVCDEKLYEETRDDIRLMLVSDGFVEVSIDDKILRHMEN